MRPGNELEATDMIESSDFGVGVGWDQQRVESRFRNQRLASHSPRTHTGTDYCRSRVWITCFSVPMIEVI